MIKKQRKSLRLRHYDYSQAGLYFITICIQQHKCLFGQIKDEIMVLNDAGKEINQCWLEITHHFPSVKLHQHVIMPNHLHGIIELVGAPLVGALSSKNAQPQGIAPTIGTIVGAFKSLSTNCYIKGVKKNGWQPFDRKLWQRNYYEHIIRSDESHLKIIEYIDTNALRWQLDKYYTP